MGLGRGKRSENGQQDQPLNCVLYWLYIPSISTGLVLRSVWPMATERVEARQRLLKDKLVNLGVALIKLSAPAFQ